MSQTPATLPLGIDIGETRIRVALARRRPEGTPELVAVATRPRSAELGSTLADAVGELRTGERRCILGVGEPAAILRSLTFPSMRRSELERAARFEASRLIDYPIEDAHVRVVPSGATVGASVIGVVRKDVIAELRLAATTAKLRVLAVDNNALALRRALPGADAILDIGRSGSVLYVYGAGVPRAHRFGIGGTTFTAAIVDALGSDDVTAERRKLAHGIAGSGHDILDRLVANIASALVDCRANGYADVRHVMLVGNGARLDDLAGMLERAAAVRVALATLAPEISTVLPPDVLRAAAPDWSQAYGLALWAAA